MSLILDGTNGVTFPNSTVQAVAGLPTTGGNLSGSLAFTQSNAGITFANSSALTNSQLNDYEVGTWTPVVNGQNQATCLYTKIGRTVVIGGDVTLSFTGGPQSIISGLPFSSNTAIQYGAVIPYQSNTAGPFGMLITNSGYLNFYNGQTTGINITTGSRLIFTLTYLTSA